MTWTLVYMQRKICVLVSGVYVGGDATYCSVHEDRKKEKTIHSYYGFLD